MRDLKRQRAYNNQKGASFYALILVCVIFNISFFSKDRSARSVIEDAFREHSMQISELGEIDDLIVPPTKPYIFIACNDTDKEEVFAAFSSFDFFLESWVSHGWVRLSKGCRVIDTQMRGPLYAYAMTLNGQTVWAGGELSAKAPFCLDEGRPFTLMASRCMPLDQRRLHMTRADVKMFEQIYTPQSQSRISKPFIWRIKKSDNFLTH